MKKKFFLLTLVIALASSFAISVYHLSWLRSSYRDDLERNRQELLGARKENLKGLVDLVIYWINLERRLVRQEWNIKPDDVWGGIRADDLAKTRIANRIRNTHLAEGGYFWINEIRNYDGGDGFAIRLANPETAGAEGTLLSTNTRDLEGRYVYREELEGLKKSGELFFEYLLPRASGGKASPRLCYAKLYRDFNWVIATDLNLDDLDRIVAEDAARMNHRYERQLVALLVSTLLVLIGAISLTVLAAQRSYKVMRDMAEHDELTGLLNRRIAQERIYLEAARSLRGHGHFSAVMCDLDFFKKVNDTWGHPVGDIVLRSVANVFRRELRATDLASRWGGEEFLLILDGSSLEEAALVAERIRSAIERETVFWEGHAIKVTLTLGIAEYDGNEEPGAFLRRVDAALYQGKKEGRNRVVASELDDSDPKILQTGI